MAFPFDDYAAALLLFVFGILHLRAAWNPDHDEADQTLALSDKNKVVTRVDDVYTICPSGEEAALRSSDLQQQRHYQDGALNGVLKVSSGDSLLVGSSSDVRSALLMSSTCDSPIADVVNKRSDSDSSSSGETTHETFTTDNDALSARSPSLLLREKMITLPLTGTIQ